MPSHVYFSTRIKSIEEKKIIYAPKCSRSKASRMYEHGMININSYSPWTPASSELCIVGIIGHFIGIMGRRNHGSSELWVLSELWVVGIMGRQNYGSSELWVDPIHTAYLFHTYSKSQSILLHFYIEFFIERLRLLIYKN